MKTPPPCLMCAERARRVAALEEERKRLAKENAALRSALETAARWAPGDARPTKLDRGNP